MDLEEDRNLEEQEETSSIIDADWSVIASYKPSTARQDRGYPGHANYDPELLTSDHLTVDGFIRQAAKINFKNINKYGKQSNKVSSDERKGPKRRYNTLRRLQESSNSLSSRGDIPQPGEHELRQPRSNRRSCDALADGSSSQCDRYSPSIGLTSSPSPSAARPYHMKPTNRQRKRTRKKRQPLRVRLYEAAISTHVEPEAAFAQAPDDPEAHHRLPLRFLPEPTTPIGIETAPPRKKAPHSSLIDPRGSRAIEDARFPAILRPRIETGIGSAGLSNTLDYHPIDSWCWDKRPEVHSRAVTSAMKKRTQANAGAQNADPNEHPRSTCAPLTFVPLAEAEPLRRKDMQHRR